MKTFALCGFMAAGKSSLVKHIAERFKINSKILVSDLDQLIELESGASINQIFFTQGESRFRQLEEHALAQWLDGPVKSGAYDWAIIALGGGALHSDHVRDLLQQEQVVLLWIDTPWEICLNRIQQSKEQRPLANLSTQQLRSLYERRKGQYQQSDFTLNGAQSEAEMLETFVQLLAQKIMG